MKKNKNNPNRPRRKDSFLGIHFDMHANSECTEVGKNVTLKMVETIIEKVHPDYVHCDCTGVYGLASYPTKVGHPAPGFVRDPLRIWRDTTARHGVALYVHVTGVYSAQTVITHPSWARMDAAGKRSKHGVSMYSPYLDKEFIPMIKEIIDTYDMDGVWVDGDCCWVGREYAKQALADFRKQTGIRTIPKKSSDPYFYEFTQFFREKYRRYLKYYIDELHRYKPDFEVCCALAYSSGMPEKVTTDMDFISGDTTPWDGFNSARMEARSMMHQGLPWDVALWGFTYTPPKEMITKSAVQMQQEAAVMMALGGGVTVYFYQQKRDASVTMNQMEPMAEVAKFCRARQPYCHKAKAIPQIALLHSTTSYYRKNTALFNVLDPDDLQKPSIVTPIRGILQCLLESQNVVDVVMEHHLENDIQRYPLIVIPESEYLEGKFKKQLLAYVKAGGSLLVIGVESAKMFKKELGVKFIGQPKKEVAWLGCGDVLGGVDYYQPVKLAKGRALGRFYKENDFVEPSLPAASVAKYGKGKIAAIYANIGEYYTKAANVAVRKCVEGIVRELFPDPQVQVTGSHYVDVALNRLNGKRMINLVNTAGPHADSTVHGFDEIPVVGPLEIVLRVNKKPKKVTLEPEHRPLKYTFAGGKIKLTLPRLEIYSIIVIE